MSEGSVNASAGVFCIAFAGENAEGIHIGSTAGYTLAAEQLRCQNVGVADILMPSSIP